MKTLDNIRENNISVVLLALACFLLGMVCGFFLAPIKNGVTIGSNNIVNKGHDEVDYSWDENL